MYLRWAIPANHRALSPAWFRDSHDLPPQASIMASQSLFSASDERLGAESIRSLLMVFWRPSLSPRRCRKTCPAATGQSPPPQPVTHRSLGVRSPGANRQWLPVRTNPLICWLVRISTYPAIRQNGLRATLGTTGEGRGHMTGDTLRVGLSGQVAGHNPRSEECNQTGAISPMPQVCWELRAAMGYNLDNLYCYCSLLQSEGGLGDGCRCGTNGHGTG